MWKWIAFLLCPWLITYGLGAVIEGVLGHSISMTIFCALIGCIYGISVFVFMPRQRGWLVMLWLVGAYAQQYYSNIGLPDNSDGSRLTQTLVEGVFALISASLCIFIKYATRVEYVGGGR